MALVTKLCGYVKIISRKVRGNTGVYNSFYKLTDERKERDRAKVFENFIVQL